MYITIIQCRLIKGNPIPIILLKSPDLIFYSWMNQQLSSFLWCFKIKLIFTNLNFPIVLYFLFLYNDVDIYSGECYSYSGATRDTMDTLFVAAKLL